MEQAAAWLQTLHSSDSDEKTLESWLEWCARDPLNQKAFDDMAEVWIVAGELRRDGDESLPPRAAQPRRWRFALAASFAAMCVLAGAAGMWLYRPAPVDTQPRMFASPVGVNQVESLPDGSVVELGGRTRAATVYSHDARRLDLLDGEIYVSVSKEARPFTVNAGSLRIIAIGTGFNVLRTTGRTVVTVTEGSISATGIPDSGNARPIDEPASRLESGQQLIYSDATHSFTVRWADAATATSWRTGTLRFVDEPLAQVIASVNRYAPHEVVIDDARIAALSFTGTARTDRIESWLLALGNIFPVTVVELADGRRLIGPRLGDPAE